MKKTNYLAAPFQQTSYYSGQWMKQSQCGRENKHTSRAKQRAQKKGGRGGAVLRQGMLPNGEGSTGRGLVTTPCAQEKAQHWPLRGHGAVDTAVTRMGHDELGWPGAQVFKVTCNSQLAADLILPVGSERHWPSSALWPGALHAALREKQELKSLLGARIVCGELNTVSCKRGRRKDQAWGTASYLSQPFPKSNAGEQQHPMLFERKYCLLRAKVSGSGQNTKICWTRFSNQVASASKPTSPRPPKGHWDVTALFNTQVPQPQFSSSSPGQQSPSEVSKSFWSPSSGKTNLFFSSLPLSPREQFQALETDPFVHHLSNPCSQLQILSLLSLSIHPAGLGAFAEESVRKQSGSATSYPDHDIFQCSWISLSMLLIVMQSILCA